MEVNKIDVLTDNSIVCLSSKYRGLLIRDIYKIDPKWIIRIEYSTHNNLIEKYLKINKLINLLKEYQTNLNK